MPYSEYNPSNYDPNARPSYELIPVGEHRVRISKAEWYRSKNSGKESIKITFDVSGYSSRLWLYIGTEYSDAEEKRKLDQRLGEFFDAFNMKPTFDLNQWSGKCGGIKVKHEIYEGEESAKIAYTLRRDKTDLLPAWRNPNEKAMTDSTPMHLDDLSASSANPQSYRETMNNDHDPNINYDLPF